MAYDHFDFSFCPVAAGVLEKNSAVCNFSKARRLQPINIDSPCVNYFKCAANSFSKMAVILLTRGVSDIGGHGRRLAVGKLQTVKFYYFKPCTLKQVCTLIVMDVYH